MSALPTVFEDIDRIRALPRRTRPDVDRRDDRSWSPITAAIVREVTSRYTRGPRVSCACQPRHIRRLDSNRLLVCRQAHPNKPPPPPVEVDRDAFLADAAAVGGNSCETVKAVEVLRPGMAVELPGLGRWFCITEFNGMQAVCLDELARAGGLFAMSGVSSGKTFLGIQAPMVFPERKQAAILIKPDQRIHYRTAYLQLREHFFTPTVVFDGVGERTDVTFSQNAPVLHILPYSLLSNTKSSLLLHSINPQSLFADEVHSLSNKKSSRTGRFLTFIAEKDIVFGGWSGSTIKKSIKDVCHLVCHALGMSSPYPILNAHVDAWAGILDPKPVPDTESEVYSRLREAFVGKPKAKSFFFSGEREIAELREAHRDFVLETRGIVATSRSIADASVVIYERKIEALPQTVKDALATIRQTATRPDGEELVDALEIASCARGVGAGYYNYWAFPKATDEDKKQGGLIDQWYAARKAFFKEMRAKLVCFEPHLDTPKLLENAAERAHRKPPYTGDLPVWPSEAWPAWAALKDLVQPDARTRWVDDYLARDAAKWAQDNVGIVWVLGTAFGKRVAELAGTEFHAGGPDAEKKILAESGKRSIVVSMKAHSEGRDGLQLKFCKQLFAEVPAGADRYEQVLGRLARDGQLEDTVETWIYQHTQEYRDAFSNALMYAELIEQETPNKQLLLAADITFEVQGFERRAA